MQENKSKKSEVKPLDAKALIGTPKFCDMIIGHECVLKCKMCDVWKHKDRSLSFDECKEFVKQLRSFVPPPLEINVMGGEPFLKGWLLDICDFIKKCGYVSIVSTNAHLIDKVMAQRIADSGLDSLSISLESLNPETHDFLRGEKGVFEKAMNAIKYIEKFKTKESPFLTILTIIMEKNLGEILELTEWVNKNEALVNISFLALLRPDSMLSEKDWYKSDQCNILWPQDTAKLDKTIDELIKLKKMGYKINNPISQLEAFKEYYRDPSQFMRDTVYSAHDYIIDLESNGDIFLSGEPLTNMQELKTTSLDKIWFSEKANNIRNKIARYGSGKRVCVINFIVIFPKDSEIERISEDCRSHQGLGEFYMYKEDFQKAISEFTKALEIDPENKHARKGIGICYKNIKQFYKAIVEFEEFLKIEPDDDYIFCNLGYCHRDLKQYDKAIAQFNKALEINPGSEEAYLGLADCCEDLGQLGNAIDSYKKALKINPENEHALQNLGFCYKNSKQLDLAMIEFKKVLNINPNNQYGYIGIGFCYLEQNKTDKAIAEFKRAIEISPATEHAYEGLGFCYKYKEDFDKAIESFNEAKNINPDNEYAREGLAMCYESKRCFDKAICEFGETLRINPLKEHAVPSIVSCCRGLEKQGKGIDEIRAIAGSDKKNAPFYYGIGLYCLEQKDFSGAISEFSKALETEPKNIKCMVGLAGSYFQQKRYNEASRIFYEVLEIQPDNSEALKYLKEIEHPDFCVIEVSHRCMFKCRMCNYWETGSKQAREEVEIADLRKFIVSLKDFVNTPFGINISGGEPLLKKGMLDLIEFIAGQGFKFSMVTNGYLINRSVARRIADSGLNFLAISLDSLDEKIHDNIRGIKGAHRKVMDALKYFDAYRGKLENITVQTIIMGPNLDGILDLVDWSRDKQFSLSFMAVTRPNMTPVDSVWYKKEEFSFLWPQDTVKARYVLDELIRLKKAGRRIDNPVGQLERFKLYFSDPEKFVKETACSLGDDMIQVNPRGDIYLCCEMEPAGNIKQGDIGSIWTSQKAESIREKIRRCRRNCAGMVNCYREAA